jgi:hypothetical protein
MAEGNNNKTCLQVPSTLRSHCLSCIHPLFALPDTERPFYVESKIPVLRCDIETVTDDSQSHQAVKHGHEPLFRHDIGYEATFKVLSHNKSISKQKM